MKKAIIAIVIALVVIIGLGSSMYTVRENEYACTVRFSEIIATTGEAGLHFKVPFIDSVKYFSKATMLYDIPPSEVLTSDKQNMTVDCYVLWKIEDPKKGIANTCPHQHPPMRELRYLCHYMCSARTSS